MNAAVVTLGTSYRQLILKFETARKYGLYYGSVIDMARNEAHYALDHVDVAQKAFLHCNSCEGQACLL